MDLRANAIITAVDRFSGPVGRMAGALRGLNAGAAGIVSGTKRATRAMSNFGSTMGMPSALAGAFALQGEYYVDRLSRQMQAVGELSDRQRRTLVENAFKTSIGVGESAQDIIKAQQDLIQGGLDPDTVSRVGDVVAKAAKTNGMELGQVAEDAINVARGLGFAFNTTEEKTASLTRALNFMSVVPALSTEKWQGLRESLKYSAPVASMLGIEVEKLGAALSILADRGFKGEEGGTAFRTMLLRGIGPTKKLTDAYRAAGIQIEDLYDLDMSMISDQGRLRDRLLSGEWGGHAKEIDAALRSVGGPEKYDGLYAFQDALQSELSRALDVTDAQDKRILKEAIDQHVFSAMKKFDLEKFMAAISKLPLSEFKDVAGIQRTSQARALMEDMARFRPLFEEFVRQIPGAVERRFRDIDRGFAQSIDKMAQRFAYLRHNVFEAGLGNDLVRFFDGIAKSVEGFAKANPETLATLTKGGIMAALAAGVGAIAASPWARAVIALTGIAAAVQRFDTKKGVVGHLADGLASGDSSKGNIRGLRRIPFEDSRSWLDRFLPRVPNAFELFFGTDLMKRFGIESMDDIRRRAKQQPSSSLWNDPMAGSASRGGFGQDFARRRMIRDIDPMAGPTTVDVTGKVDANVQGTVSGKVDVNVDVKVEGGTVTDKRTSGGELTGSLNKGKTMPDTAGP
jgi:hypothetical protein